MVMKKAKVTIAIDPDLLKRIDRIAEVMRISRSRWIEDQVRHAIDEEELAVKVFTDPVLAAQFGKVFGNPEFLRGIAKVLGDDLSDEQLKLFTDRLAGVSVQKAEPSVVSKMRKKGK